MVKRVPSGSVAGEVASVLFRARINSRWGLKSEGSRWDSVTRRQLHPRAETPEAGFLQGHRVPGLAENWEHCPARGTAPWAHTCLFAHPPWWIQIQPPNVKAQGRLTPQMPLPEGGGLSCWSLAPPGSPCARCVCMSAYALL